MSVPSKPSTNTTSNGNGVSVPSKPSADTSSNGNDAIVPSKSVLSINNDSNVTEVSAKSSNANDPFVPTTKSVTGSNVASSESKLLSSSSSSNTNAESNAQNTNLKAKQGKDLPQTGDASHIVAVVMGAITLAIAGIISFFKRDDD